MRLSRPCSYASYPSLIRALRACASLLSSIGALCAFVLSYAVLLQLKGNVCFVCGLQHKTRKGALRRLLMKVKVRINNE